MQPHMFQNSNHRMAVHRVIGLVYINGRKVQGLVLLSKVCNSGCNGPHRGHSGAVRAEPMLLRSIQSRDKTIKAYSEQSSQNPIPNGGDGDRAQVCGHVSTFIRFGYGREYGDK